MRFLLGFPIRFSSVILVVLAVLVLESCTCITCGDEDDKDRITAERSPWENTDISTVEQIIAVHSKPSELFAFTKGEFLRIEEGSENVIERRTFLSRYQALGQPAVNDLIFARGLRDTRDGADLIEFHLVLNQAGVERFYIDSLTSQLLAIEDDGAQIGAFNDMGTIYVQPVIQRTERRLGMLIFSITTDQSLTEFTNVSFVGLIDFPEVREDQRVMSSIRFIDDHFYIATKFGAYRLSESGVLETLIPGPTDIRDIFKYDGRFYATQVSFAPMFESATGQTWQSSGIVSDLRLVDVFGDNLISQNFEGWQYQFTDDIRQVTKPLRMNATFGALSNDQFFGIDKLGSTFYLGYMNRLYKTDSLQRAL